MGGGNGKWNGSGPEESMRRDDPAFLSEGSQPLCLRLLFPWNKCLFHLTQRETGRQSGCHG